VFPQDHVLANISLYWLTGAIGSSFWPYYARMHGPWPIPVGETVTAPTGYCEFPREIVRPRSVAERTFTNLQRWSVMDRGGHFAAMEQPEALAQEIRMLFRTLR
jgi:microsomal epoxide hydrolase